MSRGRSALCECIGGKQGPTSLTRSLRVGDCRIAMAFGEFGFLNGIALQKRTETEKGTNFILCHSKKLSVELLFLFVGPVRVHNYQSVQGCSRLCTVGVYTYIILQRRRMAKETSSNVYMTDGKTTFLKFNF